MPTILHLLGATGAGKTTLIRRAVELAPRRVHAVEVGEMMRAKYPPSHFKGNAAPAHTQTEAWDMYVGGVRKGLAERKDLVLVSGQPRDTHQAVGICAQRWPKRAMNAFCLVHCDHDTREKRLRASRTGESLQLALQRLDNDYRNMYVVLAELIRHDEVVGLADTAGPEFSIDETINGWLERYA